MSTDRAEINRRVLVIDDMADIHDVYRRLLRPRPKAPQLEQLEASLFGPQPPSPTDASFDVDCALQGSEGLARVLRALDESRPYAMAFVDMRMPPGWDGLETIERIWHEDPDLEIVICTAYADYSDLDIVARLGASDQVLFLRKPFDAIEVRQLARALTEKWHLRQQVRLREAELERQVATRTRELGAANLRVVEDAEQKQARAVALDHAEQLAAAGRLAAGVAEKLDASLRVLAATVGDVSPARDELGRMSALVRGLRELCADRPTGATLDLNHAVTDAAELLHGGIAACAQLELSLGAVPPVPCSPVDINLVLLGLVDSAVQAVEAMKQETGRDGRIAISTRQEGGHGVVAISDTGRRVPAALRDRLFEARFSPDAGERPGLAIAKSIIVDQHGGQLTLDCDANDVSTVLLRLPLAIAGVRDDAARPTP